jgi:hypothetical protein
MGAAGGVAGFDRTSLRIESSHRILRQINARRLMACAAKTTENYGYLKSR